MEKIQLTQKQADAIEYALNKTDDYKDDKDRLLRDISRDYVNFHNDLFPLNKIDIAVAAKALYVGYEVIPQYKAEEWLFISKEATFTNESHVRQVISVQGELLHLSDGFTISSKSEHIRHATPEEEQQQKKHRFWSKLGREVDEWKVYDVVSIYDDREFLTSLSQCDIDECEVFFRELGRRYPIYEIRLVVPVEQRLDK